MRVLMVGPSDLVAMRRVIDRVIGNGHQVCLFDNALPFGLAESTQLRFVAHAGGAVVASGQDRVWLPSDDPRNDIAREQLRALTADFQPDVIHAHNLVPPTFWCAQLGLRPLVISVWGALNELLREPTAELRGEIRATLAAAAALIVESPRLAEICRQIPGLPRVAMIPLGVDTRHYRPAPDAQRADWRAALDVPTDAVLLLSPRGLSAVYQHGAILEAFALAQPRFQRPALLAFIRLGRSDYPGESERIVAQLQARAAELGLGESLRVLPALLHPMMPSLFAAADVVINYPSQDAFPSTLLEAAACERPIISSRLPAYSGTFVEDRCTLVAPDDQAALAGALVALVNEPAAQRAAQLRETRAIVAASYGERGATRELLQLYAEVAATDGQKAGA